jgi:HK97 gp10 family phage protein
VATEVVVKNNLPRIESQIAKALSDLIRRTAFAIEARAKQLCPVDTGRLRNSITTDITGPGSATVGTNVVYAPFQEFGTRFQKGKPFLTPAFDEENKNFQKRVTEIEGSLR